MMSHDPILEIDGLTAELGEFTLRDINLTVDQGEYVVLLGPTGAGKTILLEVLAGIYTADSGQIRLHDRDITDMPPKDRPISMVYQDYMLFPHLSVEENIRFGQVDVDAATLDRRVERFVNLLDIEDLLHRRPRTLSGGERQRVALARSLVMNPEVLLLDEPISALDIPTKERIIEELRTVQSETEATIIHVTHHREDALRLADRIGILNDGRIVQTGPAETVFAKPNSRFVARFVGTENIFNARIRQRHGQSQLELPIGATVEIMTEASGNVLACVRPEHVDIRSTAKTTTAAAVQGTLESVSRRESTVQLEVDAGESVTARMTTAAFTDRDVAVGESVAVDIDPTAVHVIDDSG